MSLHPGTLCDAHGKPMLETYAEHDLYTLDDAQLIAEGQSIQCVLCPLEKALQPVLEPKGKLKENHHESELRQ